MKHFTHPKGHDLNDLEKFTILLPTFIDPVDYGIVYFLGYKPCKDQCYQLCLTHKNRLLIGPEKPYTWKHSWETCSTDGKEPRWIRKT